MISAVVNTLAVILGSGLGMLFKKGLPERLTSAVMIAIGLCTLYIGVSGLASSSATLVIIFSMVLGAIAGTLLDLDGRLEQLGELVQARTARSNGAGSSIAQGFVTASLLFCVGSMTITGSLQAGLTGDNSTIYAKSLLDFVSALVLGASLGFGVMLSSLFVLIFQGGIVLLSSLLEPVLTTAAIGDLTCVGSLLVVALSLNILGITKLKVANYLPAILLSPVVTWIAGLISTLGS